MTDSFVKGFSERNLRNVRQFFLPFPIWQTVSAKLSRSHYILIMRVELRIHTGKSHRYKCFRIPIQTHSTNRRRIEAGDRENKRKLSSS
ncbi:MAG: DUF1016 domain-containing protein [Bacteroidales bacterium]|nr:DUF1016 domain-containing protein [Bacteroidales bacterium]